MGRACVASECVPADSCASNLDCAIGETCDARDTCVPAGPETGCVSDATCAPSEVCVEGSCRDRRLTCSSDLDCGLGRGCVDNEAAETEAATEATTATEARRPPTLDLDTDEADLDTDEAALEPADTTEARDARDGVSPAERQAYEEAHALHFEAHDSAGAVTAWDRYLADYPGGRFAVEAAYNRALALVRLGRRDEARAALEPFATGAHGAYRRHESEALLQALGDAE